jgi:hypothetical protein
MAYHKLVRKIPTEKRKDLSDNLVDLILKSKKGSKMPSALAKNWLDCWRKGPLTSDDSLAVLLEVAVLTEPEKTVNSLVQKLQLVGLAEAVEQVSAQNRKSSKE